MGVNGVINSGGMPGSMQMMQPQGGYIYFTAINKKHDSK